MKCTHPKCDNGIFGAAEPYCEEHKKTVYEKVAGKLHELGYVQNSCFKVDSDERQIRHFEHWFRLSKTILVLHYFDEKRETEGVSTFVPINQTNNISDELEAIESFTKQ
jgi:hypothetical protein